MKIDWVRRSGPGSANTPGSSPGSQSVDQPPDECPVSKRPLERLHAKLFLEIGDQLGGSRGPTDRYSLNRRYVMAQGERGVEIDIDHLRLFSFGHLS